MSLKSTVQPLKRQRSIKKIMNNVENLYNNYFNFYKKTYDESTLNERKRCIPKQFKLVDNMLPKCLESKNDFNEAKILMKQMLELT